MPLTDEQRSRLLNSTRDAAAAFAEDMEHLREVCSRENTSRREIRHLSAILRRLVVDRDIASVASPRIGKITLQAIDNRYFYRAVENKEPIALFIAGGAKVFKANSCWTTVFDIQGPANSSVSDITKKYREKVNNGPEFATLNLDQFAQQKVIFFRGRWITRQRVIKYLANIASGVHSDAPSDPDELALAKIRSANSVSVNEKGGLHFDLFKHGPDADELEITHNPQSVDLVLVEVLSAAQHLIDSPMLRELEEIVRKELDLPKVLAQPQIG